MDFDGDVYPSDGDIYLFYDNKDQDPDEIYLTYNGSITITMDDSYVWYNSVK
jgi:hypothetical protein